MQSRGRPETESGAVLWDGFGLQTLHSGVGRHAWDLLQALERRQCSPKIIPSVPELDAHFAPHIASEKTSLPKSRIKPWSLFWSARWLKNFAGSADETLIVHGLSNYNLPLVKGRQIRKVLTVHDLIPILNQKEVSKALGLFLRFQLPRALRAADAIICVSRWTENTLHERYPETRGKTTVIPNGWPSFVTAKKRLPGPLQLLTISRTESYKRLSLIPEILKHLPEHLRWTLVTDARGQDQLGSLGDARLMIRQKVSDQELEDLHQAASVYVHPSLWEGFCLPAASSISHGVPVLHTRGSGIDEVVAKAGLGLDAAAPATAWAAAILDLAHNPDMSGICRTRSRSALSWDDVAASTLMLYDKIGER